MKSDIIHKRSVPDGKTKIKNKTKYHRKEAFNVATQTIS